MKNKNIFFEHDDYTGTSIGLEYEKYLHQSQSKYQNIEIISTRKYGNAMYLDGCFMLSEKNQDYYHNKCINLVPKEASNILIIGGGDFAIASMLSLLNTVESITIVEIDMEVVELSKRYFSGFFNLKKHQNKKINLIIQDGNLFLKSSNRNFDCIIIDSTDPVSNAKVLFSKPFLKRCFNALSRSGVIIQQSGSPLRDRKVLIDPTMKKYNEIGFKNTQVHDFPMPLYPTGTWSFLTAERA